MKLKKYIALATLFIFCTLMLIPSSVLAEEKGKETLSLQEALDLAYKNNPDLRKAELEVDKAQILRDDAVEAVDWIPTGGLISPAYQQLYNGYQQAEIGLKTAKKARDTAKERITKEVISAYTKALKDYNTMETTRLELENMKEQMKMNSVAKSVGYLSEHDYTQIKSGIKQMEEGYKAAQSAYEGSFASLRYLLGRSPQWDAELTSRAVLNDYERDELSVELSRGVSESVLVWTKEALLDIEESKQEWVLPNVSSDMQDIDLGMAQIDYEQAKRTARSTIEGLYHTIDALEGQVSAAELAWQTAQKNLEIANLKYELGMIAKNSMVPGAETLAAAELEAEKAKLNLESLKASLAQTKAEFAFLTDQTVYSPEDWQM